MKYARLPLAALLFGLGIGGAQGAPLPPLPEEPHINQSLMAGVAGDEIRKTCDSISPRYLVVWSKLYNLRKYAIAKGYERARVKAFMNDPVQKARIKSMAMTYLKAHGAVPGNAESYCAVGRQEIAKKSLIGVMLRMK